MPKEILVTLNKSSSQGVSWMELMKLLVTAIASIAIPITIFFVGKGIEGSIKKKELETKYVEISVNILIQEPNPETENLRIWAIDNINQYSEIKLSDQAINELKKKPLLGGTSRSF